MTDCTPAPGRLTAAERQDALRMLEEHHSFPCIYMFKVIGYNSGEFAQKARRAAEAVLGPLTEEGVLRSRPSGGGKYLAVTIDTQVESSEQVLAVYDELRALQGMVMVA